MNTEEYDLPTCEIQLRKGYLDMGIADAYLNEKRNGYVFYMIYKNSYYFMDVNIVEKKQVNGYLVHTDNNIAYNIIKIGVPK